MGPLDPHTQENYPRRKQNERLEGKPTDEETSVT